jgi:SAM-dependent methyltransferase
MMSFPHMIYGLMMSDRERNRALARVVEAVVRPGDVVVDVGAGAGFLSILAARAGARRVYAIEGTRMASVAEKLIARNGCAGTVEVVHGWSHEWQPRERADVVLSETLGYAVLDEGFRRTVADARERFLRPGGRLVPESVDILVVPIESAGFMVDANYIASMEGLDFEPLGDMYRGLYQRAHVRRDHELATPALLGRIDCYTTQPGDALGFSAPCEVQRPGTFAAHALWFDAVLADDIRLSSRDPRPANHWGQTILPARCARAVTPGEIIELEVIFDDRGRFSLQWETTFQHPAQVSSGALCGR